MKCPLDDRKLKIEKKYNGETKTIAFEYYRCSKCRRMYKDGYEIVIKGYDYINKKDLVDPMQ